MEWLAFWGSIIGGLIGGLFTFLGVRYTIKHENKKAKKEELKEADSKKPRFEIVKFKDFESNKNNKVASNSCNVLALKIEDFQIINGKVEVFYDESVLDEAIVFMNTSKQAARIRCATIGWDGLEDILCKHNHTHK